ERTGRAHLGPRQSLRSQLLGAVGEVAVELVAREVGGHALGVDALHAGGLEDTRLGPREHLAEVDELQPEAQVWFVDAKAVHGVMPRDARDRIGAYARDRFRCVENGNVSERED